VTRARWDGSVEHGTERTTCGGCGGTGKTTCPSCGGGGTVAEPGLVALAGAAACSSTLENHNTERARAMPSLPPGGSPGFGPVTPGPFELVINIYYEHPQDHRVKLVFLAGTSQLQVLLPMGPEARFNAPQLPEGHWVRLQDAAGRQLPVQVCRNGWRVFAEWRSLDDTAPAAASPPTDAGGTNTASNAGAIAAAAVAVGALAVTGLVAAVTGVRKWFGTGPPPAAGPKEGERKDGAPPGLPAEEGPPGGPAPT
jgi:hypothetical protein